MKGCRSWVFHVEGERIPMGATAPGFGWQTALNAVVQEFYTRTGATQSRWVAALATKQVEANLRFERWMVTTSRDEQLEVVVREVTGRDGNDDEGESDA